MEQFTCLNCEGTFTGSWEEVKKLGWRRHQYGALGDKDSVVMCGDCEAVFKQRRQTRAKFDAVLVDAGETTGA